MGPYARENLSCINKSPIPNGVSLKQANGKWSRPPHWFSPIINDQCPIKWHLLSHVLPLFLTIIHPFSQLTFYKITTKTFTFYKITNETWQSFNVEDHQNRTISLGWKYCQNITFIYQERWEFDCWADLLNNNNNNIYNNNKSIHANFPTNRPCTTEIHNLEWQNFLLPAIIGNNFAIQHKGFNRGLLKSVCHEC